MNDSHIDAQRVRVHDLSDLQVGDVVEDLNYRGYVAVKRSTDEAVPPLPTEPYTVILTKGKRGFSDWVMVWYGNEWHQTATGTGISASELQTLITGFEVLADPRAVTAKAVLDRAMVAGISGAAVDALYREFGVDQ